MIINGKAAAAALVNARAAMKATVTKDSKGNFGKYADLANVVAAITPALADNALALVQEIETDGEAVIASAMLVHETGETIEFRPLVLPVGERKGAQAIGAVITYARRYQLMALFGLAPDDDLDNAPQTSQKPQERTNGAQASNHTATAPKTAQKPATQPTAHVEDAEPVDPDGPQPPTEREAAVLNKWNGREDAEQWAMRLGTCANEFEARNSYEKVVKAFGGEETGANRAAIWLAFMRRQGEKWAAKQGKQVAA